MPEVELNLAELKTLVSRHFQVSRIVNSTRRDATYVFAGFGKYQGKYSHHVGKRVLVLEIHTDCTSRRISLFFELLLPLVNALARGERVTTKNFGHVMDGVSKNDQGPLYPDPGQNKDCYLATALAVLSKTGQSEPTSSKSAGEVSAASPLDGQRAAAANVA